MDKRKKLKRLVELQSRLKALHETRRAMHLDDAAGAEAEARQIAARIADADGLSDLFPELYYDRVGRALARKETSLAHAVQEARNAASANARANMAERAHADAVRRHERKETEKTILEMIERHLKS